MRQYVETEFYDSRLEYVEQKSRVKALKQSCEKGEVASASLIRCEGNVTKYR